MRISLHFIGCAAALRKECEIVPSSSSPLAPSTLEEFAVSSDVNERAVWFRFAIDYFYAVSDQESSRTEQIARQTIAALGRAGPIERVEVARQLSMALRAPSTIFDALDAMGGEAGGFVMRHCAGLSEERVVLASKDPEKAGLVAARAALPAVAIDLLIGERRIEPLLTLLANESVWLTPLHVAALAARAREAHENAADPRLAVALLRRPPLGPFHATLFFAATPEQRLSILAAAQRAELGHVTRGPAATSQSGAIENLEQLAMAADEHGFINALAQALDVDLPLARRIAEDVSGDALTLALAALQARDEATVRILVSVDLNMFDSRRRVAAFARLKPVLSPRAAWRVLNAIRGHSPAPKPSLRPQLDPVAAPTSSRTARSAVDPLSPGVERRRRAFALTAGRRTNGNSP